MKSIHLGLHDEKRKRNKSVIYLLAKHCSKILLSIKSYRPKVYKIFNWVRIPGQKRNIKKIFLRPFPLSRFLAKTLRVN